MNTASFPQRRNGLFDPVRCRRPTFSSTVVTAAPEDDVRLVFEQFVKAQNAHDAAAV
jgi:hypothetical protein